MNESPVLSGIAIRAHNVDQMVAFYTNVFGGKFNKVDTGGLEAWFGQVAGFTMKIVGLRDDVDFEDYPVHQIGFIVDDVDEAVKKSIESGGRQAGEPMRQDNHVHGAVRDPDGNTIELEATIPV